MRGTSRIRAAFRDSHGMLTVQAADVGFQQECSKRRAHPHNCYAAWSGTALAERDDRLSRRRRPTHSP